MKRPLFDICITGFAQNFFNRILGNEVLTELMLLKGSFSVHFNDIVAHGKSCVFSLIPMVQIAKLHLVYQNDAFVIHVQCFTDCLILT